MKILQVGKFFSLKGGIETVTQSFVDTLQDEHVVDVLCFSQNAKTYKRKSGKANIWEAGKFFSLLSSPISIKFFTHFRRLRNSYDIILVHVPNPLATVALLLFSTKAKIIVQWHGDILNKGLFYYFFRPLERLMLKRANLVLPTSAIYIDHSPALSEVREKCRVLPLGIDEQNLKCDPALVQEIRHKYGNRKIVFSLGRFVYYKGFEYLIEAATHLPEDMVVIIGGYGPQKGMYQARIEQLNLQDKVFLIPETNNGTWGSYYAACDVFCLPSFEKAESFGIVLLEAMSFAKPIVATKIKGSGTPWVNKHGVSGLNVSVKNSKEIASAILEILLGGNYNQFSLNSRQRFDELFTQEIMVDRFKMILRELNEGKKPLKENITILRPRSEVISK